MIVYIYGLVDPRNDQLRYVGATDDLAKRLKQHIADKNNNHKVNWIKSLKRDNLKPDIFTIEEVDDEMWEESERFWIAYFRYVGADLTNMTDGGEGLRNPSEEVRAKISYTRIERGVAKGEKNPRYGKPVGMETRTKIGDANKKYVGENNPFYGKEHSPEQKEKWSLMRKGIPLTEEHRQNIAQSQIGRKHKPETIAKMSGENNSFYGKKHTPESLEKMRKASTGKKHSPESKAKTSASVKATLAKRRAINNSNQMSLGGDFGN